jgi:hypothetical protein
MNLDVLDRHGGRAWYDVGHIVLDLCERRAGKSETGAE